MILKKAFSSLFLFACASCLPSLHGPVVENIGADPFGLRMFNEGKNMAITYKGNKDAEIYQNNGAGFALKQVLVGTINSHDISMTEDARYLYLNAIYNLLVL